MNVTSAPPLDSGVMDLGNWDRLMQRLQRQSTVVRVASIVCLTLGIGWVDLVTGWELSLFVFYGLPVVLAVWLLGGQRRARCGRGPRAHLVASQPRQSAI